ncbi:MAG: hypothetical protein ACRDSF_15320 [Pseudonocardiaceae bacterium]
MSVTSSSRRTSPGPRSEHTRGRPHEQLAPAPADLLTGDLAALLVTW